MKPKLLKPSTDKTGWISGRLTVLKFSKYIDNPGVKTRTALWLCQCECGNTIEVRNSNLNSKATKSCGCIRSEYMSNKNYKHGQCKTSAYKSAMSRLMHMKRKYRLPKWADIESKPVAFCTLYRITCSPLRTCNEQELGGPMDDIKVKAIELANAVSNANIDTEEIEKSLVKVVKSKNQNTVRKAMPYSMSGNIPQWASKKSDAVKKVAIDVFNQTLKDTGSEEKARIASLASLAVMKRGRPSLYNFHSF